MLKVSVAGMRMGVRARYRVTGSVLDDSVMGPFFSSELTPRSLSSTPTELEKRLEEVSVLFLDITGYRRLSERLDPKRLNRSCRATSRASWRSSAPTTRQKLARFRWWHHVTARA